jgi:hypothetical protein
MGKSTKVLVKTSEMYALQHGDFFSVRKKDPDANPDMKSKETKPYGSPSGILPES